MLEFSAKELWSLNHVDTNLNLWFLIKSGYYIVPSPSTALVPEVCSNGLWFLDSKFLSEQCELNFYVWRFQPKVNKKLSERSSDPIIIIATFSF
jgi:hypothetical protein